MNLFMTNIILPADNMLYAVEALVVRQTYNNDGEHQQPIHITPQ